MRAGANFCILKSTNRGTAETLMNKGKLALVAAAPGILRDALTILMQTIPHVEEVHEVKHTASLVPAIKASRPAVVLLDTDIPGDGIPDIVKRIKAEHPQVQCLVLANTVQQKMDSQNAGADKSVLKGYPAAQLFCVVEEMMK